jgi:hypothetical protein
MGAHAIDRRKCLMFLGAATLLMSRTGPARAVGKMTMHKSATCGCCSKWAARMREAGFEVEEVIEADMAAIKTKFGVPTAMQSCHTARIDGYLVEGHVPADALHRLLTERPGVLGVAAPGMPAGSPGMEAGEAEVYPLYLFDAASSREFGKWRGSKPA